MKNNDEALLKYKAKMDEINANPHLSRGDKAEALDRLRMEMGVKSLLGKRKTGEKSRTGLNLFLGVLAFLVIAGGVLYYLSI